MDCLTQNHVQQVQHSGGITTPPYTIQAPPRRRHADGRRSGIINEYMASSPDKSSAPNCREIVFCCAQDNMDNRGETSDNVSHCPWKAEWYRAETRPPANFRPVKD